MRRKVVKPVEVNPAPALVETADDADPITAEQYAAMQEAMRQLSLVVALLDRLDRCQVPCEEVRAVCNQLVQFFKGLRPGLDLEPYAGPLPNPFDHQHYAALESGLRELAVSKSIIERCKKCSIPVDNVCADCEAAIDWYQKVLAEFKGAAAPIGNFDVSGR